MKFTEIGKRKKLFVNYYSSYGDDIGARLTVQSNAVKKKLKLVGIYHGRAKILVERAIFRQMSGSW